MAAWLYHTRTGPDIWAVGYPFHPLVNHAPSMDPTINHPQVITILWLGFKPSPNGWFMVLGFPHIYGGSIYLINWVD